MHSKKVKGLAFLTVLAVGSIIIPAITHADECDPTFKDLEVFYCKVGRVEHKIGLKKDTRPQCVEHRKLNITGCTVETVSTEQDTKYLYIIGPEKNRKDFNDFKFQCDNDAGNNFGGMDKSKFEGYMAPNYTLDKFPSESNQERSERFIKDLAKQGKVMYGGLIVSKPYVNKFDTQLCQYFNVKTNKVALKLNCVVNSKTESQPVKPNDKNEPAQQQQQQPDKKNNPSDSLEKGFKGLFGR